MSVFDDVTSKSYARVTGALYLLIAVAGIYAIAFAPTQYHVEGDALATLVAVSENRAFFISGIFGDVVMMVAEILVTVLLFYMFRAVQPVLSAAAALARFAMVAVMAAMLIFHSGLYAIATGDALGGLEVNARADIGYLLLTMHNAGVWVWQVFFTLHLVLLGALVIKSGMFPHVIGYALAIGGLGYIADSAVAFAMPDAVVLGTIRYALLALVTLAELGFALWLVFVGPRAAQSN